MNLTQLNGILTALQRATPAAIAGIQTVATVIANEQASGSTVTPHPALPILTNPGVANLANVFQELLAIEKTLAPLFSGATPQTPPLSK